MHFRFFIYNTFLNIYRFYSTVYMNSRKRANFSDDDILALLENSDDDGSTDSEEPCMQDAEIHVDSSLFF